MVNQELLDWINKGKEKGYNSEQLKDILLRQGYVPEEINQALNICFNKEKPENVKENPQNAPEQFKEKSPDVSDADKEKRPLGIKLIAYFHYLLIVIMIASAIISVLGNNSLMGLGFIGAMLGGIMLIFLSVFIIGMGLICFFAGRGIWKGKKGWKIFVIIISAIVFISQVFLLINYFSSGQISSPIGNFIYSIFFLLASISIFSYLVFNKTGKNWFKK
jgi:hypothetical protein